MIRVLLAATLLCGSGFAAGWYAHMPPEVQKVSWADSLSGSGHFDVPESMATMIMTGTKTTCYADGKKWESPLPAQCSMADKPK